MDKIPHYKYYGWTGYNVCLPKQSQNAMLQILIL